MSRAEPEPEPYCCTSNQLDTCLRRIDNIVLWRKRVHRDRGLRNTRSRYSKSDEVLVELAALCNRFGLKLYFMGRLEASNAFYSRVLQFSHANSTVNSGHNPELYAWTCDLIAFCLWHQGKFESAHHALSRSVHPTVTTNIRIVSRLHAALLLLNQDKADLSLKISSSLLIELLQQRHAHTLLVLGPGASADATQTSLDETAGTEWAADIEEILRIIEFRYAPDSLSCPTRSSAKQQQAFLFATPHARPLTFFLPSLSPLRRVQARADEPAERAGLCQPAVPRDSHRGSRTVAQGSVQRRNDSRQCAGWSPAGGFTRCLSRPQGFCAAVPEMARPGKVSLE